MQPLNLTFRHLLFKNIGNLTAEEVDKYERLTALRHQLTEDKRLSGKLSGKKINEILNKLDAETNEILRKHKSSILKIHRTYIGRRKLAFHQNRFFQLAFLSLIKYLSALFQDKWKMLNRMSITTNKPVIGQQNYNQDRTDKK